MQAVQAPVLIPENQTFELFATPCPSCIEKEQQIEEIETRHQQEVDELKVSNQSVLNLLAHSDLKAVLLEKDVRKLQKKYEYEKKEYETKIESKERVITEKKELEKILNAHINLASLQTQDDRTKYHDSYRHLEGVNKKLGEKYKEKKRIIKQLETSKKKLEVQITDLKSSKTILEIKNTNLANSEKNISKQLAEVTSKLSNATQKISKLKKQIRVLNDKNAFFHNSLNFISTSTKKVAQGVSIVIGKGVSTLISIAQITLISMPIIALGAFIHHSNSLGDIRDGFAFTGMQVLQTSGISIISQLFLRNALSFDREGIILSCLPCGLLFAYPAFNFSISRSVINLSTVSVMTLLSKAIVSFVEDKFENKRVSVKEGVTACLFANGVGILASGFFSAISLGYQVRNEYFERSLIGSVTALGGFVGYSSLIFAFVKTAYP